MTHPAPITLFDYICALASTTEPHHGPSCDAAVPGGCERCHAALTSHTAYFARFGLVRCPDCIGNDGFATVADLELFRQTATLRCSGCSQLIPPARISPDGTYTYYCRACGTIARFSMATVA
jgi:hypothetical protein